jgi:hypothetical protein
MVVEQLGDLLDWKARAVGQAISELVIHLAQGLLLLAVAVVAAPDLVLVAAQAEAWSGPVAEPAKARGEQVARRPPVV